MAKIELKTKHPVENKGEVHFFDPRDIVVQENDLRGRKYAPSKSDVKELAESIGTHGQQQDILVYVAEDGSPTLVFGRTRLDAILLLNNEIDPRNPRKIAAKVTHASESERFLMASEENAKRKAISVIDQAFNQEVMRTKFGMQDKDIAEKCGMSQAWVSKFKKLLLLDSSVQKQVHEGAITVSDAISMADLELDKQKKIAEEAAQRQKDEQEAAAAAASPADEAAGKGATSAKAAGKKPKSTKPSRESSRATRESINKAKKEGGSKGEGSAVSPRTMRDVRGFFETLSGKYESEEIFTFCKLGVKFCSNKISDQQFENALFNLAMSGMKAKPAKADTEEGSISY